MNALLKMPIIYCVVGIAACALFESIRAGWTGLIVLGALVSLYAWLAKGQRDESRFRTGDNSYFIGFVYTLSVITLSLILDADTLLGGAGGGVSPLLKTIGIALGTSVVGMLWRFWLTHDIVVAEDAFDDAVRGAAVAAASLTGAMHDAAAAADALKGVVSETAEATAPLRGAVREAADAAAPLTKVVNGLRQTIDDASIVMEAQVRANGAGLDSLVSEFRERLEAFSNEATASLAVATKHMADEITKAVRTLAETALAENGQTVRDFGETVNAHAESVQASMKGFASSLDGYTESIHISARKFGATLDEATKAAVDEVAKGVAETLRANTFADARRGLEDAVRTYQEGVARVNQTLKSAVDGLAEATAAAVAQAGEARSALAEVDSAAFRKDLENLTAAISASFRQELQGLSDAILQLRDTVSVLTEQPPKSPGANLTPPFQVPAHPVGSVDPRTAATGHWPSTGHDSPPAGAPTKTSDVRGFGKFVPPWFRR